jgi:phospholipase C
MESVSSLSFRRSSSFLAMILAASCSGPQVTPVSQRPAVESSSFVGARLSQYVKHVVIIVQENRSFENIFAGFSGADAPTFGYMPHATKVTLEQITFAASQDMSHEYPDAIADIDHGKMDGFGSRELYSGGTAGNFAYSFLAHGEVAPYWTLASRFVLADHMFPTILGPSFTAHLALVASMANINPTESLLDYPTSQPWGCDAPSRTTTHLIKEQGGFGPGPFPCFTTIRTMADSLDAANIGWKYYAPAVTSGDPGGRVFSAFDAIHSVRYGPDWKSRVISPPAQILVDAKSNALPSVAWVMPDYAWSDHPGTKSDTGPSWVAAIVNAIGSSKAWTSTAIVVVWDDWGGFYDNVFPPSLDYRGLGIRVPCLIVSPYVQPHVSHTQYEFGSILRFVEDAFQLPRLGSVSAGYTDSRAASIVDSFDFTHGPRTYSLVPAKYPASYFLNAPASMRAPDNE